MNPLLWLYLGGTALTYGFMAAPSWLLLRLAGARREEYAQRLGHYPDRLAGRGRVWIQAVSVGEVRLARGLLTGLKRARPELELVLSTSTRAGYREALKSNGRLAEVIYFPLDSPLPVRRALKSLRPELVILIETELWPTFLYLAFCRGVKVGLINGRISDRTAPAYRYLAPGFRPLLNRLALVGAAGAKDAARLLRLGAPPARLVVTGNAKVDSLVDQADRAAAETLGRRLDLQDRPVFVAGSIRSAEIEALIEAGQQIRRAVPEAVLILAPRHLNRVGRLARRLDRAGIDYDYRSQLGQRPRRAQVVILDTMGELFHLYCSASVALAGGSLSPLGGQNPLEPAFWGVPVLFGRHMDDFTEAAQALLAAGGARQVSGAAGLAEQVIKLLGRPEARAQMGQAASQTCRRLAGSVDRSIELILSALDGKG